MPTLAAVILTYNEELHLRRALACVRALADQIVVVDSFSTDATIEIAAEAGATVLRRKFTTHAEQFNWALDQGMIECDWVLRLDADEVIEHDLALEIRRQINACGHDVTGLILNRKHYFMGRWIRHGGRFPMELLRVWRRGKGRAEDRGMDEHIALSEGRAVKLKGGFADINLQDLTYFVEKHSRYAILEAREVLSLRASNVEPALGQSRLHKQAARRRWIKERLYIRLPFGVGPVLYFVFRYVFQLGFLDGKEGAIYHFLQGFWYRFLVEARILEIQRLECLSGPAGEQPPTLARGREGGAAGHAPSR